VSSGQEAEPPEVLTATPRVPIGIVMAARLLLLAGVGALVAGLAGARQRETWSILLVNALFWLGMAQGAVAWAAVMQLSRARWCRVLNEAGHACVGFVPFGVPLVVLLYFGREYLLPWIGQDVGDRGVWLNVPGVFARNLVGLALLGALSIALVWRSRRVARGREDGLAHGRDITILSVALLTAYTVVFSILAFDFVMALKPFWHSTLIGPYFFCSAMLAGLAALMIAIRFLGARPGSTWYMTESQWLDMGNLLLAFVMLTAYMFFAHLLVIWYADMPSETVFLTDRWDSPAWRPLTVAVMLGLFVVPFLFLTIREAKQRSTAAAAIAVLVLVSAFVERYLLVTPSLLPNGAPFGAVQILVTLGFAAASVLTFAWVLDRGRLAGSQGSASRGA
jgi:Ni/Fe-hydrogenase subunit HybB-like protein